MLDAKKHPAYRMKPEETKTKTKDERPECPAATTVRLI